ncbi:MAG: Uncharacterised protein [Bacteroidetes bacterium MED-G17]|nr:MAG: Uncharacterised protein [Bacteroidetes bacterium MED-G17]
MPSLTPYFFLKDACSFFLKDIIADMSTSLNVVRIAAVFCASFNLLAIVCLSLDIGMVFSF